MLLFFQKTDLYILQKDFLKPIYLEKYFKLSKLDILKKYLNTSADNENVTNIG